MNFEDFTEQIFFATLRIEFPNKQTMGTGFLVHVPSSIEGLGYFLLVSNKHILNDPREELRIVFHGIDEKQNIPKLTEHHAFAINKIEEGAYYAHPSPGIDLACLNVSDLFNIPDKKFYVRTLSSDQFSDFTDSDLQAGKEVLFVGYPEDRYDHAHNLPILRGGKIASIPKIDFENMPLFLVDAQVFQGSSGSPIFTLLGGNYKLIGVIAETMIKSQKLEVVEKTPTTTIHQVIGIGLAYKVTCVRELIRHSVIELNKFRK